MEITFAVVTGVGFDPYLDTIRPGITTTSSTTPGYTLHTITVTSECLLNVNVLGGGRFLATSSLVVSDETWRCSSSPLGRGKFTDVSDIPFAQVLSPMPVLEEAGARAKWIWVDGENDGNAYCRVRFCNGEKCCKYVQLKCVFD